MNRELELEFLAKIKDLTNVLKKTNKIFFLVASSMAYNNLDGNAQEAGRKVFEELKNDWEMGEI